MKAFDKFQIRLVTFNCNDFATSRAGGESMCLRPLLNFLSNPPVPTAYAGAAPDVEIPRDPLDIVLPGTYRDSDFGRPVCLTPKMVSFLIEVLDWCLVLAPAVAAFRIYSSVMHQSVAEPGHQILTSFLGATTPVAA